MATENTTNESVLVEQVFDFSTDYTLKDTASIKNTEEYKDTIRDVPNKRKITILSQGANEMEVLIERYAADPEKKEQDGTPITASIMQDFEDTIKQADQNATTSYNMVQEVFARLKTYLEKTQNNMFELEKQIGAKVGTSVLDDNGDPMPEFDSRIKLDKAVYDSAPIIANVSYDSSTDTFTF